MSFAVILWKQLAVVEHPGLGRARKFSIYFIMLVQTCQCSIFILCAQDTWDCCAYQDSVASIGQKKAEQLMVWKNTDTAYHLIIQSRLMVSGVAHDTSKACPATASLQPYSTSHCHPLVHGWDCSEISECYKKRFWGLFWVWFLTFQESNFNLVPLMLAEWSPDHCGFALSELYPVPWGPWLCTVSLC